jgi:hypothetical protein
MINAGDAGLSLVQRVLAGSLASPRLTVGISLFVASFSTLLSNGKGEAWFGDGNLGLRRRMWDGSWLAGWVGWRGYKAWSSRAAVL